MDRGYYQEYYFLERNHWWFKVRASIIINSLENIYPEKKVLRILNVGSATGLSTEILSQFGHVTSVEYDRECAEFTFKELGVLVINASVLDLPFKSNSFDLVCAFDVIEHVEDDQRAVNEMKRVCRSSGVIFITVPALNILWSRHDVVNNHYRRYTMRVIAKLFDVPEEGEVIHKTYFNSILLPAILVFRVLSKVFPNLLIRQGAGSDFTLLKNENPINKLMFVIFSLERLLLKKFTFFIGTSILFSWKKYS